MAAWGTLRLGRGIQTQLGCGGNGYSCRDQQALATGWDKLILVQVPPSALRGRIWCVGVVAAPPLHTTQHWPLICQVNCTSSGALLATKSLTRPHCCSLHSQQQSFPWVCLAPCLSAQPLPALANSCLRQGCSGLILEEALRWMPVRTSEFMQADEA